MPVELVKSPFKVCRIIGENVFSTVVEEDINVPDINPDVYKVLTPSAVVMIKDCEILTDKILISGNVLVNILYAADVDKRPLSSMDVTTNFSQSLDMPGVKPRMKDNINAVIQHVECSMINSRKISIRVIMDIKCKVEEIFELEVASDVRGLSDIQILREPCSFRQLMGYNKDQFEVSDMLELPIEKPEINKILKSSFRLIEKEERTLEGKVEINGMLGIGILYTSLEEENPVNFVEYEVPYNQYIEVPEANRAMECITDSRVGQFYLDGEENENGERRKIKVNAILDVTAKVYNITEVDIVGDAYSPTNVIELGKEMFTIDELVGKGHSSSIIKESMSVQRGEPEIDKLYSVEAVPMVNDTKIVDDRIIIEGILDCTAIYMTSYSAEPMCSMKEQLPFRHYVEISGIKLDMHHNVKCSIDNITFSVMNSEMVDLRVVLNVSADIWKQTEKKIVAGIEEIEGVVVDPNRIPAVTVYIAQKGDTLWSIAKRYNTTVDALARMNNIENPTKIYPGMQIMILKNVRIGL